MSSALLINILLFQREYVRVRYKKQCNDAYTAASLYNE